MTFEEREGQKDTQFFAVRADVGMMVSCYDSSFGRKP